MKDDNKKKRRAKGTDGLYKTPDGRWIGQIVIGRLPNGSLKYKRFSSKTQSKVIEKMRAFKKSPSFVSDLNCVYVDDYIFDYIQNVKSMKLKPTSYDRDINTAKLIKQYLCEYQLGQLNAEIIQGELINKLKQDGYAYSTIHKVYVMLNEALNYAFRNKKISDNPCLNVVKPSKKLFDTKQIRYFDDEEIKTFIECALSEQNGKPKFTHGIMLCLDIYTGLRRGELTALKWSDIDFKSNTITVNKNIIKTSNYGQSNGSRRDIKVQAGTKTNEGRIVYLNKQSLKFLDMLERRYKEIKPNGFIINNTLQVPYDTALSDSYKRITKSCNINNPLGIHTLRHTFASLLIRKGVDIKVVSELLGHKDVAFTYNTYVHLIEEQKAQAMELLDLD